MSSSDSIKPDPTWNQVRETVKLLTLSAAQVDVIMQESDLSVNALTESFTEIIESLHTINSHILSLDASYNRDQALACSLETKAKVHTAIIAFQFYDRLQQCLQHVASNLRSLSALVENPEHSYNPAEWQSLLSRIRSTYSMESEKIMFDAILQGKSIDDAVAAKEAYQYRQSNDIELF
jgi:hypothetical protein